jgi:DHA1 family bicyclomycin/chloramphenicol resistance-like MFS transporter
MVASKAIVRDLYDKEKVADVLSNLLLIMGVAPIIAPSIGGLIIQAFSWHYVFYGLAAFASLMLFNVIFFLPESAAPNRQKSLRPLPVLREYWSIYKNHDFFLFSTARGFVIGILLGYVAAAPFIFQEYFDLDQTSFSIYFGANAASLILGSQINRWFLRFYTTFQITYIVSFLLMIVVFTGLSYVLLMNPIFWVTYPILFVMMMLVGFQNPNVTALALQPFTKKAGSASAFVGAVSMIFGSVASWYVAQFVDSTLIPLFVMLSICGLCAHVAIEVYRSRYARGYAFAKANFKQLSDLKKSK